MSNEKNRPLPNHLAVTWDEIETGFHEYSSEITKEELDLETGRPTSFPPEFADWRVGMDAARQWLAAHDARVKRDAAREVLTDLAESSLRTAKIAAERGDKEWERDARFVAREALEHRNARYPEEAE